MDCIKENKRLAQETLNHSVNCLTMSLPKLYEVIYVNMDKWTSVSYRIFKILRIVSKKKKGKGIFSSPGPTE